MERIFLLPFAALTLIAIVGCANGRDGDDKSLKGSIEQFQRLKADGKIPGLNSNDAGELSVFRITDDQRHSSWFQPFESRTVTCSSLSMVDVTSDNKHLRLFFCGNVPSPGLIALYRFENGSWQEDPIPSKK